jgi:hypothetical protein
MIECALMTKYTYQVECGVLAHAMNNGEELEVKRCMPVKSLKR